MTGIFFDVLRLFERVIITTLKTEKYLNKESTCQDETIMKSSLLLMSTRDNRLPMFITLKNPWCHKSSVSKFLFGTLGHLQLLVTKTLCFWEMMLAGTGKAYQN